MARPTAKMVVKLTANFERNLASIEAFCAEAGAPRAFEALLDELLDTVIPNLERFPGMGRPFLERPAHSVEVATAQAKLRAKLGEGELREYLLMTTLVLYVRFDATIHLLAIKHHRQLSFDFDHLWAVTGK